MSNDPNRLTDYLDHILTAIWRIYEYCEDIDDTEFSKNTLIQDAVIRNFEVIGEASRNIERKYPEFFKDNPGLPLVNAYEMRNALAHGYFKVDLDVLWTTIYKDLPALEKQIQDLI